MKGTYLSNIMPFLAHEDVPIIRQRVWIATSPKIVYDMLTSGAGWDRWFTKGTEVDARAGGFIKLQWSEFGADRITLADGGPVLEAKPHERFVFQWQPGSVPTTVAFTLASHGDGTILEVRESGYRATRDDLATLAACATGWGEALMLLKAHLEYGVTYGKVPPAAD